MTNDEIYSQENAGKVLCEVLDDLKQFLLDKNRKYGNSVICPCRTFSTADSEEQIKVRLDDKITRIKNHQDDDNEDPIWDIAGYISWLLVLRRLKKQENETTLINISGND